MTWNPISTGPRDGRQVLLHHDSWYMPVIQGSWDAHEQAWRVLGFGCVASQPQLWHPLPDSPQGVK